MSFQRNIGIRRKREYYLLALPRRLHQLVTQQLRGIDLDDDLSIKISSGAIAQILVRGATKAIRATVDATAVAVDCVIEANVRAIVMSDYCAGLSLFKNFQLRFGGLTQPLD